MMKRSKGLSLFERYFGKTQDERFDVRLDKLQVAGYTETPERVQKYFMNSTRPRGRTEQASIYIRKLHRLRKAQRSSYHYFKVAPSGIGISEFRPKRGKGHFVIIAPRIKDEPFGLG